MCIRTRYGPCRLADYTLLIIGLIEGLIIVYYVATIIIASYIHGGDTSASDDLERQYWASLLAVRYFVLFALFGFPISLMIRNCRPVIVYGVKNTVVAAYALTSSVSTIFVLTMPSSTSDAYMRAYGATDAAVNSACAFVEIWLAVLVFNMNKARAPPSPTPDTNGADHQQMAEDRQIDSLDDDAGQLQPPVSPIIENKNAITSDLVSILLGKV